MQYYDKIFDALQNAAFIETKKGYELKEGAFHAIIKLFVLITNKIAETNALTCNDPDFVNKITSMNILGTDILEDLNLYGYNKLGRNNPYKELSPRQIKSIINQFREGKKTAIININGYSIEVTQDNLFLRGKDVEKLKNKLNKEKNNDKTTT